MKMKKMFLDFDGTLADPKKRLYELFKKLESRCDLTFEEYWEIKSIGINQRDFLETYYQRSDEEVQYFKRQWMQEIESTAMLSMDALFPESVPFLDRATERYDLYLVSARQRLEPLENQLKYFGINKYFADVIVTGNKKPKNELISEFCTSCSADVFVGDTGEDVLAGKALGVKTVAVSTGVMNRERLSKYFPDYLVDSLTDINLNL